MAHVGWLDPVARRGRIVPLLLLACGASGLTLASRVLPYQLDDAYINYRYAANWAAGSGFTYNPGQAPVEGFTSPLWLLGLAFEARVAGPGVLPWSATLAGLVCYLLILWAIGRPAWRGAPGSAEGSRGITALVSAGLFALLPTAHAYSVTGLETLLFAALVVLFAMSLAEEAPRRLGLLAGGFAIWVRPEGGWFLVAGAAQLLAMGALGRPAPRRWLTHGAMVVFGGVTLLAFRLAVFGAILPNTYYAKTPSLASGVEYVAATFAAPPLIGLLACAVLGACFGSPSRRGYLAAAIAWTAAAILEGGDWMPGGRLLLPALAMLALASGGLAALFTGGRLRAAAAGALLLATLAGEVALSWVVSGSAARAYDSYRYEAQVLVDWVKESRVRSIALIDIGEMGFKTGIEIVDLAGLTDRVIARAPGHHLGKEVDLRYLFEERVPDLVMLRLARLPEAASPGAGAALAAIAPTDAMSLVEGRVLADSRLARDYAPLFLQVPDAPRAPLNARVVYLRKGVRIPEAAQGFKGVITFRPQRPA